MTNLRNKTVNAINTKAEELGIQAEDLKVKVLDFIDNFCGMTEEKAQRIMLQLKVTPARPEPEEAETKEGEVAEATEGEGTPEEEKPAFVPKYLEDLLAEYGIEEIGVKNVGKVLGDAATSYKESHPDCWLAVSKDRYPKELRDAVGDDITLLTFIEEKCKEASYFTIQDVNKILRLTADEKENKRFGGLKALKFSFTAASYLKDVANLIGKYFETFLPEQEKVPVTKVEVSEDFVPSQKPEKTPEQKTYNLPQAEETPQEEKEADKPIAIPEMSDKLDVQQILEHGKYINSFLYFRKKLLEAGVNPDLVVRKAAQVRSLLKAAKDLQQQDEA